MSNKPYKEPVRFNVGGYRLNDKGEVAGHFGLDFNVRTAVEAIEQAEYIFTGEDIIVIRVERTNY